MIEMTPILYPILAQFAAFLIYIYFYIQDRQPYMALWVFSWFLFLGTIIFLDRPFYEFSNMRLLAYTSFIFIGSMTMLIATCMFVGIPIKKRWCYVGIFLYFLLIIFGLLDLPFELRAILVCLYVGIMYVNNGLLFIRKYPINGLGKYLTGGSFIILGAHLFNLPFLVTIDWMAPWGFAIDAIFRYLVVIGTILLYFEKTRNDLMAKEHYYRLLADNASDVIYRFKFRPNKLFDYVSPSVTNLTGYLPEDFYKSTKLGLELVYPNDRPILNMFIRQFALTEQLITFRLVKKDQSIIWVEQKSVPFLNSEGKCIGFDCIVRDITDRRNLEQDISRLDKLNLIGQLAASFAHEVRNPMTTVRGYLQYFSSKKDLTVYKDQFNIMIDELDRTNVIIKEYLSLSQNRTIDLKLTNLNNIIESMHQLIQANANATCVDISLDLQEIPELYLDEKEIRQLILNLARNGIEAMEKNGGILKISSYQEKDRIVLVIQDEGSGIDPHVLENIGKPFITTKDTGTGLGLAICYRIVNRHQAEMKVHSTSAGTTFMIYFKNFRNVKVSI